MFAVEKEIKFETALRKKKKALFSSMVKPVGSMCNLRCNYCYYLDKELQVGKPKIMSEELLEKYIKDYINGTDSDSVIFCWHGGEPLLAGKEFYRKAISFQKKYCKGKKIENTIQTNGTLIDREWADLFASEGFLTGVSIDGPESIHNTNRPGSYEKAIRGVGILKEAGAEFNTLSAISAASAGHGKESYRFFKEIGSHYMQFLPVVEHVKEVEGYSRPVICSPEDPNGHIAPWSVTARDYGIFLVDVFDTWVEEGDIGNYYVQIFDATLSRMCGLQAGVCSMNDSCGDAMVVEHDGSVYCCDHFVYPQFKLGNICEKTLREMYGTSLQFQFGAAKSSDLPDKCRKCAWTSLCNGECPKHRFSSDGYVNYLCTGLQHFFRHSTPLFSVMRDQILSNEE